MFDDSFKGAGARVGVEIWRIEKLKVVKKGPDNKAYEGQFHTGDSYIILQTRVRSCPPSFLFAPPRPSLPLLPPCGFCNLPPPLAQPRWSDRLAGKRVAC